MRSAVTATAMTDAAPGAAPVMLVTGGTGSIGSAVAQRARAEGWRVITQGRGANADIALDASAPDAAARLVEAAAAIHGRLDAVVDCLSAGPAGFRLTGPFHATEPAGYDAFLGLSAGWFQRLAHAAWPHLAERGGTLIAFVSDAGKFAAPNQTIVGAARAAPIGFVRNLAVEAARDGIRAHCISPSFVAGSASAEQMGSQRMAKAQARAGLGLPTAEDIAPITVFLCGPGAARITGQVISVNGGLNA